MVCCVLTTPEQTMIKVIVHIFKLHQSKSLKVWNFNHIFLNTNSFNHFMNSVCRENRIYFSAVIFFAFHNWIWFSKKRYSIWIFIIKNSDFLFAYFFFILGFFIFNEIWVKRPRYLYNRVNQNIKIWMLFSTEVDVSVNYIERFGTELFCQFLMLFGPLLKYSYEVRRYS